MRAERGTFSRCRCPSCNSASLSNGRMRRRWRSTLPASRGWPFSHCRSTTEGREGGGGGGGRAGGGQRGGWAAGGGQSRRLGDGCGGERAHSLFSSLCASSFEGDSRACALKRFAFTRRSRAERTPIPAAPNRRRSCNDGTRCRGACTVVPDDGSGGRPAGMAPPCMARSPCSIHPPSRARSRALIARAAIARAAMTNRDTGRATALGIASRGSSNVNGPAPQYVNSGE